MRKLKGNFYCTQFSSSLAHVNILIAPPNELLGVKPDEVSRFIDVMCAKFPRADRSLWTLVNFYRFKKVMKVLFILHDDKLSRPIEASPINLDQNKVKLKSQFRLLGRHQKARL